MENCEGEVSFLWIVHEGRGWGNRERKRKRKIERVNWGQNGKRKTSSFPSPLGSEKITRYKKTSLSAVDQLGLTQFLGLVVCTLFLKNGRIMQINEPEHSVWNNTRNNSKINVSFYLKVRTLYNSKKAFIFKIPYKALKSLGLAYVQKDISARNLPEINKQSSFHFCKYSVQRVGL